MPDRTDLDSCTRFADLAEAFVDGELEGTDDAFARTHAAACPACAAELARARELAAALRRLPEQRCPPRVTAAVLARAAAEDEAARARREELETPQAPTLGRRWLPGGGRAAGQRRRRWAWQTGLAAAAVVALTVATALLVPRAPSPAGLQGDSATRPLGAPAAAMTPAEAARAEDQVKLAFAYIGRVGRQAGDRVTDEVIDNVIAPARRAFGPPEPGTTPH
jgi:anti-sigma factor RsiW